jgi:hypothetical protein
VFWNDPPLHGVHPVLASIRDNVLAGQLIHADFSVLLPLPGTRPYLPATQRVGVALA